MSSSFYRQILGCSPGSYRRSSASRVTPLTLDVPTLDAPRVAAEDGRRWLDSSYYSNIVKHDGPGHDSGNAGGELGDLIVNIREPRVTSPTSHFLDEMAWHAVQKESHCTGGANGMRADTFEVETL